MRSSVFDVKLVEHLRASFRRGTWMLYTYLWNSGKSQTTMTAVSGETSNPDRYSCPAGHKGLKIVGFPEPLQGRGTDGTLYERVIYDLACEPCNLIFRMTSAWIEVIEFA